MRAMVVEPTGANKKQKKTRISVGLPVEVSLLACPWKSRGACVIGDLMCDDGPQKDMHIHKRSAILAHTDAHMHKIGQ